MRFILHLFLIGSIFYGWTNALSIRGASNALSRLGRNFGNAKNYLDDIQHVGELAGYNFAALGTYWRSNTLAAFAQMKRGEIEESMETLNLAIASLAVWDLGQGIAYPIADKIINKIVLKYQDDFRNTLQAFRDYRTIMQTDVLDDATKAVSSNVLKGKIIDAKGRISAAFQLDVETGLASSFKNTQIYADLVTDLQGVKTWVKAAKWADVLAGPVFDAATVAVSAWQLAEAIKSNDPYAIASSSLSLASGLAGLTAFAVAALATAGSTIAAVAGPIGAVIGAVLGIASIIVEIIAAHNPYNQIDQDIERIKQLTDNSKIMLDANIANLQKLVPSRGNFSFSWVYEVNEGLMLAYVRGRVSQSDVPVKFRLENPPREDDGYMVVGENQVLDKGKYPNNVFWNPSGLVNIGYDFYGKKVTEEFNGVTVLVSTDLVAGKPDVVLKGVDIVTYNDPQADDPDNVVIGDMYDIAFHNNIKVATGGGDDVIQINGLVGKPGVKKYTNSGHGWFINIDTTDGDVTSKAKENNILSFEGMSEKQKHDYGIIGVEYRMENGQLRYRTGSEESPKLNTWGEVKGIKMFVGTPFNDIIILSMDHDYVIRELKGHNKYILQTTGWQPFKITIDDQSDEPGQLTIVRTHSFAGVVESTDLVFSKDTQTLLIYGRQTNQRWQIRGRIFFNRRLEGYHMVRTEFDGVEKRLDEFPDSFSAPGEEEEFINSDVDYQYYFDRSTISGDCGIFKVFLNVPEFETGSYKFYFFKRKNKDDQLIMTADFVKKCIHKAQRSVELFRSGFHADWSLRLLAPGGLEGLDDAHCPGKDFQLAIKPFEKFLEQTGSGETRLVVDLYRDKRYRIDVSTELKKLENRQEYKFENDLEGKLGIPQVVMLKEPNKEDPSQASEYTIDLKGGQKLNEDSLIFTEELRKWLKRKERKITLTKEPEGTWKMDITKSDGTATHTVNLKNIERIDYEPSDGSLRQPVIIDLATETQSPVDLEAVTAKELRRNKIMYPPRSVDCNNRK